MPVLRKEHSPSAEDKNPSAVHRVYQSSHVGCAAPRWAAGQTSRDLDKLYRFVISSALLGQTNRDRWTDLAWELDWECSSSYLNLCWQWVNGRLGEFV